VFTQDCPFSIFWNHWCDQFASLRGSVGGSVAESQLLWVHSVDACDASALSCLQLPFQALHFIRELLVLGLLSLELSAELFTFRIKLSQLPFHGRFHLVGFVAITRLELLHALLEGHHLIHHLLALS
jgi:hypothetical protein